MPSMQIMQLVMTGLWMLMGIAFAVVFLVKYKASPTGILGGLGSMGNALVALAWAIAPPLVSRVAGPDQFAVVFAMLNLLNLLASGCVFVAILLAPVPRRQPPPMPAA